MGVSSSACKHRLALKASLKVSVLTLLLLWCTLSVGAAPIAIEVWTNFGAEAPPQKVFDDMVAQFNAAHPDIVVIHRVVPGDIAQRYSVSIAGGVTPDVGWVSPDWFVPFYSEQNLVPVEDLVLRDGIDASAFWPGVWKQGVGGRQWGMPFEVGSEALIYNQDWFDAAGIGSSPETWDDFLSTARRLTDPQRGRWGFEPGWPGYMAVQWIWRNGGRLISEDLREARLSQPETVEAVQWLADLERVHQVTGGHVPGGSAAMIVVHTGWFEFAKTFPFTFETGPAPISETGQRASLSYYKELVIFRSTPEREEAAWTFVRWFSEPEQQAQWGERTGYLPVNRHALQSESYQQYLRENPRILPWIAELDYIRNFPLTHAWPPILHMFETALTNVRQGQAAGTVLASAQSAAQAILDELAQ